MEKTLRITAKGREVIKLCSKVGNYSFDSIEKLRLYEVGVLKGPTGDKYTDNYIGSLLKGGFLEEVPDVPDKPININWKKVGQEV